MSPDQEQPVVTRRGLRIALAAIALVAIGVVVAGITTRRMADAHLSEWTESQALPVVAVAKPDIRTKKASIELPGRLEAYSQAQIFARVSGYLKNLNVDIGTPVEQALQGRAPPEDDLLYSAAAPKTPYLIEKRVLVSGGELTDAQPGFDQRTSEPIVSFRFNTAGSRKFAQATQENVGKPFAIVLDNEVISAPVIREPILGGSGQISGSFTVQSAWRQLLSGRPTWFHVGQNDP